MKACRGSVSIDRREALRREGQGDRVNNTRGNLIGSISANHMLDSLVTTWVILHPSIDLEDVLVDNDYMPSICDKVLDFCRGHDTVVAGVLELAHLEGVMVCVPRQ